MRGSSSAERVGGEERRSGGVFESRYAVSERAGDDAGLGVSSAGRGGARVGVGRGEAGRIGPGVSETKTECERGAHAGRGGRRRSRRCIEYEYVEVVRCGEIQTRRRGRVACCVVALLSMVVTCCCGYSDTGKRQGVRVYGTGGWGRGWMFQWANKGASSKVRLYVKRSHTTERHLHTRLRARAITIHLRSVFAAEQHVLYTLHGAVVAPASSRFFRASPRVNTTLSPPSSPRQSLPERTDNPCVLVDTVHCETKSERRHLAPHQRLNTTKP